MTDEDYMKATNSAKITIALDTIRQVVCGKDYGVNADELMKIRKLLCRVEENVFNVCEIEE